MLEDLLISHIGIAVEDLDEAISRYSVITGDNSPTIEEVPDQKVKVAIFSRGNKHGRIELVAATSDKSPVARYLLKKGEGLHHVCLYVENIDNKLRELKEAGVRLIDQEAKIGAGGSRIAFVHPASCNGVLIELEETSD